MSDLISREEALNVLQQKINDVMGTSFAKYRDGLCVAFSLISKIPSAETHEIRTETHGVCLISKDDAMSAVQDHFNANGFKGYDDGQKMMDRIKALPSAETVSRDEYEETDGVVTIEKQNANEVGKIKHIVIRSPNYTRYFYNENMPFPSADAVSRKAKCCPIAETCMSIDCPVSSEYIGRPSADAVPQSEQYKKGFEDAKRAFLIEYARESENMRKRNAQLEVMLNAQKAISADAVHGWIPLSHDDDEMGTDFPYERDGEWVIVTDGKNISVERIKKDAYDHFFPNGRWFELEDVIAWMPLPTPYKGGDE